MKVGDLVKPTTSCSGEPSTYRCESALVINMTPTFLVTAHSETVEILCKHGISMQYPKYLEALDESR